MRLSGHKILRFLMLSAVLLIAISPCQAQEVVASRENDRAMTGEPIFSHGMYYTGMVNYEGEMIPSFLFADYYVFADLVFKNHQVKQLARQKTHRLFLLDEAGLFLSFGCAAPGK